MCFVVIFFRVLGIAPGRVLCRARLSVGGLEDLTLGGVVSEELLNQVDVGEKHTAAAVAGKSQFVERLTFSHALATIGVNQLDVFGPEVTDDLAA